MRCEHEFQGGVSLHQVKFTWAQCFSIANHTRENLGTASMIGRISKQECHHILSTTETAECGLPGR